MCTNCTKIHLFKKLRIILDIKVFEVIVLVSFYMNLKSVCVCAMYLFSSVGVTETNHYILLI